MVPCVGMQRVIFYSLFISSFRVREQVSVYFSLVRNEMGPVGHGDSARMWKVLIFAVPKSVISIIRTQALNPDKSFMSVTSLSLKAWLTVV